MYKFFTLRATAPARFGQLAEDSLAIDEEASSIGSNFNQKSSQKRPTSAQNRPKIGPKSVQNRLRNRLRFQDRFGTDFEPILAPTWGRLGGQNRAMLGPCWPKY